MRALLLSASFVVLSAAALGIPACAKGGDTTGFHQVGGSETSTTMQGGASTTTPTTTRGNTTTDTNTGGTTTTSTTDTGGGGAGGQSMDCTGTSTCTGATKLMTVHGDDDDSPKTLVENGTKSAWYTLDIDEDSDFSNDLSFVVTLASPQGSHFDLYVYEGDKDGVACTANAMQGFGTPAKFKDCWGDTLTVTDDRHILIEVRYVSGTCDTQWTLTITGNPCDQDCSNAGQGDCDKAG